jgi:hypothetical protein
MAWGGANEQQEEQDAGNPDAKDWQDEARQIVETVVRAGLTAPVYELIGAVQMEEYYQC